MTETRIEIDLPKVLDGIIEDIAGALVLEQRHPPPDTDYQHGYRDALEEQFRMLAARIGVPYDRSETIAVVARKLLKFWPSQALRKLAF